MRKHTILYLSSNDGSDMRITKEVRSLSREYDVIFMGVREKIEKNFIYRFCKQVYFVRGKRNTLLTIFKKYFVLRRIFREHKIDSIHVINEQLMIFFYPLLFKKHTVLDIFDSIFFTLNKSGKKWGLLKRIVYAPVDKIIVTDENRKSMMPSFTQKKIIVLENYPNTFIADKQKEPTPKGVTILYNGWLGVNRGTDVAERMLDASKEINLIMAGWCIDERTRLLCGHPRVEFLGVITQQEALQIAFRRSDYILCVYAPVNENNINASPNKIYDSIQTETPVIINAEARISNFILKERIGFVLPSYNFLEADKIVEELENKKGTYNFPEEFIKKFTWENIDHRLLNAHHA